jgi:hypothetical protein
MAFNLINVFEEGKKKFNFIKIEPYPMLDNKLLIMKNLFTFIFILLCGELFAQTKVTQPKPIPYDTIVRFGDRKIPVVKLTIGSISVTYALPSKPDSIIRLERKEIEKIIFRNGNITVLNKAVVEVVRDDQWQAILVTRDENEVQGLYKRGLVSARSATNSRDKKKAEESATIKIQKKAAMQKAYIILITHEEYYGGYGDPPGYYVEGVSYGTEPLETGTNVVDPKNKTSKDNKDSKTNSKN